eukprot:Pgem_evm1s7316
MSCYICSGSHLHRRNRLLCSSNDCDLIYHLSCVGYQTAPRTWICYSCTIDSFVKKGEDARRPTNKEVGSKVKIDKKENLEMKTLQKCGTDAVNTNTVQTEIGKNTEIRDKMEDDNEESSQVEVKKMKLDEISENNDSQIKGFEENDMNGNASMNINSNNPVSNSQENIVTILQNESMEIKEKSDKDIKKEVEEKEIASILLQLLSNLDHTELFQFPVPES